MRAPALPATPTIAVVVTTFEQARYLGEALASVADQVRPADEIIVVDDGSSDDPATVVAEFAGVRLIRQDNAGPSAARNAGMAATGCNLVVFLDADDRLTPEALFAGERRLVAKPEVPLTYGAYRLIDAHGGRISPKYHAHLGEEPFRQLLAEGNLIAMLGTVMWRRSWLIEAGGFDVALRTCEDFDLYLRMARQHPIDSHDTLVAEYRHHGQNTSSDYPAMLATACQVIDRHGAHDASLRTAVAAGKRVMQRHYLPQEAIRQVRRMSRHGLSRAALAQVGQAVTRHPIALARSILGRVVKTSVRALPPGLGKLFGQRAWSPRFGKVDFGDFDRTRPIGQVFGFDRGKPVDRHYIDLFLDQQRAAIHGRVLEIGDNEYTLRFGGDAVTKSDILHVHTGNPIATFVGDMSDPATLPADTFDAIVLTQTLHLIFDMAGALANLHAALRPGGVLLVTVPGISPIEPWEWRDSWFWSLTDIALERLLDTAFPGGRIEVEMHGNVYSAVSFLAGLATEELDVAKLAVKDRHFPVLVAAAATKALEA